MKLPYAFSIRATRFPQLRLIVSDRPVLDHTRRIPAHSASMRSCRSAPASSLVRTFTSTRSRAREASAATSPSRLCSGSRPDVWWWPDDLRRWPDLWCFDLWCFDLWWPDLWCFDLWCFSDASSSSSSWERRRFFDSSSVLRRFAAACLVS